jgi:rSAM/selenodomain-associated transferase 1
MTELVVFGREPRAGAVKTRLARRVGAVRAARAYELMLETTLELAVASGLTTRLCLADPPEERAVWPVPWELQARGHLGLRMAAAITRAFDRGAEGVVIIGSDCPELSVELLQRAAGALRNASVVIGPACDGGYWTVGTRDPGLDLFSGIPWSSADTFRQTVARLEELGCDWLELDRLQDLDTLHDLEALATRGRTPMDLLKALERAVGCSDRGDRSHTGEPDSGAP